VYLLCYGVVELWSCGVRNAWAYVVVELLSCVVMELWSDVVVELCGVMDVWVC